jgi:hypothetical protein
MVPSFRFPYLTMLAFAASGLTLIAQESTPSSSPSLVAESPATATVTNNSGVLEPWRAAPGLNDSSANPSPVAPESRVLQSWRASPNLEGNPVEPSPPNPEADQLGSDSPLKPMTPSDFNSAMEEEKQTGNNAINPMDTNNLVSVEQADNGRDQLSPPLPGSNLTKAPTMDLSTADLVSVPGEEARHLWRIVPRLFASTLYDNNIYITKSNPVGSMLTTVGLGARLDVGDYTSRQRNYFNLAYFGTYNMYSAASQENSLNQLLSAEGQYAWTSLTAKYKGSAIYINGPSRDTGSFVKGTYVGNSLTFTHDYSPKTTLKLAFFQRGNIFSGAGLQNNEFYDVRVSALYHITPKITLGPDAVAGLNFAQNSPDQRYQILNMNANYELSGKVNLKAQGGFEVNEYATGGQTSFGTSVFDLGAQYTPAAGTSFNLLAYRNLNNSASLVAQDYIATGFSLTAMHTVFRRWQPELQLGFENDQYVGNLPSVLSGRVDNYYFLTPALCYAFLKDDRMKMRLFFTIRANVSNQEQTYGWQDNQVGLQLSSTF